jgi:hypothetical protein
MKKAFRYLVTVYAAAFAFISVLVAPEAFHFMWPFFLVPLFSIGFFALSYALRESDTHEGILTSYSGLFQPSPDRLPREMLGRLRDSVERPLFNLWRACMVVPLCFAAAYWIIIHTIFGGDDINIRSWLLLASGGGIAVLSLLFSRRIGPLNKFLWCGLTVLAYLLLFAGAMFIGIVADVFHCFGVGWH